jgi:hypothetical protein
VKSARSFSARAGDTVLTCTAVLSDCIHILQTLAYEVFVTFVP